MLVILVPQLFPQYFLTILETGEPRQARFPETSRHVEGLHDPEAGSLSFRGGILPAAEEGRTQLIRAVQILLGQARRRMDGVAGKRSSRFQDPVTFSQHGEFVGESAQDIHVCDSIEETTHERQCRAVACTHVRALGGASGLERVTSEV